MRSTLAPGRFISGPTGEIYGIGIDENEPVLGGRQAPFTFRVLKTAEMRLTGESLATCLDRHRQKLSLFDTRGRFDCELRWVYCVLTVASFYFRAKR